MDYIGFAGDKYLYFAAFPMLFGIVLLILFSKEIDALSIGDEEAKALGINTFKIRIYLITISTLISALSVTLAGIIGWIGLVIPHIVRFLYGVNNRLVIKNSAFFGGIFLLFCDNFSRIAFTYELPIGVITSFFGIPVFIFILYKNRIRS